MKWLTIIGSLTVIDWPHLNRVPILFKTSHTMSMLPQMMTVKTASEFQGEIGDGG